MDDILNKIRQLQTTEEQLYKAITQNAENVALGRPNTFSDLEIQNITTQINSLSAARVNLYNSISNTYHSQAINETNAKSNLEQQTKTLHLLEQELNKSKEKLSTLKDEKHNQLKMIEINTYYSKQYDAHRRLMRMITIVGVCLLFAIGLEYTPLKVVSTPLTILICVVGGALIVNRGVNMALRRNDNYDEFIWPMAPTTDASLANSNKTGSPISITGLDMPYLCTASSCCNEGTVWNDKTGCVVNTELISTE
jgi:hypothetical protein